MKHTTKESPNKSRGMSFDDLTLTLLNQIANNDTLGNVSLANRKAIHFYAAHLGITATPAPRKKRPNTDPSALTR